MPQFYIKTLGQLEKWLREFLNLYNLLLFRSQSYYNGIAYLRKENLTELGLHILLTRLRLYFSLI